MLFDRSFLKTRALEMRKSIIILQFNTYFYLKHTLRFFTVLFVANMKFQSSQTSNFSSLNLLRPYRPLFFINAAPFSCDVAKKFHLRSTSRSFLIIKQKRHSVKLFFNCDAATLKDFQCFYAFGFSFELN